MSRMFKNEGGYVIEFNAVGYVVFFSTGKKAFERSAFGAQIASPTFRNARASFP